MIHLIAMKLPSGNNLQSILTATKMQTVQATRPAVCSWEENVKKAHSYPLPTIEPRLFEDSFDSITQ